MRTLDLIEYPSPANLQSNRLSLHVSDDGTSCSIYVASGCHIYIILVSLADSLVDKGKDSLLIPEQTQIVDSAIVNRYPHRSEIEMIVLNETERLSISLRSQELSEQGFISLTEL
ncbi:unnamed protein product [Lactuca virosa]|uniref:Uncharacterized protein n=1 Tax=Lactuca virosa TaxID=75947 RepID=A0AAU9N9K7_9ASTR|nr:unnamed protein product [Lactuca virosa]